MGGCANLDSLPRILNFVRTFADQKLKTLECFYIGSHPEARAHTHTHTYTIKYVIKKEDVKIGLSVVAKGKEMAVLYGPVAFPLNN